LFEEFDVASDIAGQLPNSLTTCSDVHKVQTGILSSFDVCLSHVCILDEHQQTSDGHLLSTTTMTSAEGNDTNECSITSQSTDDTVKSDYDVCTEFVERAYGYKNLMANLAVPCFHLNTLQTFTVRHS